MKKLMPTTNSKVTDTQYLKGYCEGYRNGELNKEREAAKYIAELEKKVEENKKSETLLRVMFQISEMSHDASLDIHSLYNGIYEVLSTVIDTTNFYIARFDKQKMLIEFAFFRDSTGAAYEYPHDFPKRPYGKGLTEYVIEKRQAVLLTDEDIRKMLAAGEMAPRRLLSTSWLGVPLNIVNETLGVVVVQSYEKNVVYKDSDVELLSFVSQHISYAIKRYEERQKKHTEMKKLVAASKYDNLTGLLNRSSFMAELDTVISNLVPPVKSTCALLFIDLDGFKQVNDNHGHVVGDELLIDVAKQLRNEVRVNDSISRLGGDEFVALLTNLENKEQASHIAERILLSLNNPIRINGESVHIGASIGIAFGDSNNSSAQNLINNADIAMYKAKNNGKNNYRVFE